jgi:hypothetical protein
MAFVVKAMAGVDNIFSHELVTAAHFLHRLKAIPNVVVWHLYYSHTE